jgi:hypothetical protein
MTIGLADWCTLDAVDHQRWQGTRRVARHCAATGPVRRDHLSIGYTLRSPRDLAVDTLTTDA